MISWRNIKTVFQKEGVNRSVIVEILTTINKVAARANAGMDAVVSASVAEGAIAITAISSEGSKRRLNRLLN